MFDAASLKEYVSKLMKEVFFCGIPPSFLSDKKIKLSLLAVSCTAILGFGINPVKAQPNMAISPAVSSLNGWVGASFGAARVDSSHHNSDDSGLLFLGEGGFAAPLGQDFGFQINGWDGVITHHNFQSVQGYLFWRNPCAGLFGAHVSYMDTNHVYDLLYGAYVEAYLNAWTVSLDGGAVSRSNSNNTYYAQIFARWYYDPNLVFDAGYGRISGDGAFQIGAEYMPGVTPSFPGLSLFADLGFGNHDLRYGFVGLRYYFGGEAKPLINRHREDIVPTQMDLLLVNRNQSARISF